MGPFSEKCQVWIGANNWNPLYGTDDKLASSGNIAPFSTYDEVDYMTENCVTINGIPEYDDYNCECSKFRFLCEYEVEPPCEEDLTADETHPDDWCKAEYEPPECPEDCIYGNCQCLEPRKDSIVATWNTTDPKNVIFVTECLNWIEAQKYCCDNHNGILWEPTSTAEIFSVFLQMQTTVVRVCVNRSSYMLMA